MTDPTVASTCPACGIRASVNQMGQVYGHTARNGCPYAGTGPVERQGIYPLKFDYGPVITAAAAYIDDCNAATIRYGLDDLPAGVTYLSLRTADGDPFGIARVKETHESVLNAVFHTIQRSKCRYGYENVDRCRDALNGYYDDEIELSSEVTGLIYTPWIANCFKHIFPPDDKI